MVQNIRQHTGAASMSKTTPRPVSSSPPGHQDQSARLAASAPVDQVGGTHHYLLIKFQDYLISQKQALSPIPAMAEKVLSIDSALHELDLFLSSEGLI